MTGHEREIAELIILGKSDTETGHGDRPAFPKVYSVLSSNVQLLPIRFLTLSTISTFLALAHSGIPSSHFRLEGM